MSKKVFKEEDYNSGDGMLTTVWGPGMWHSLHCISFNYPANPSDKQKRQYMNFVLNLKNVLPCGKCRKNLVKNFKRLPLTMCNMKSRATFSLYVYKLHELINEMLGKNSGLSYEDVRERYEHFRSRCTKSYRELITKIKKKKTVKKMHSINTIKEEKGCTEPLYGDKSKCILKIVPQETKCDTFQIDKSCIKRTL